MMYALCRIIIKLIYCPLKLSIGTPPLGWQFNRHSLEGSF